MPATDPSTSGQGLKLIRAVRIKISARNDRPPATPRWRPTQCLVTKPVRKCIAQSISGSYVQQQMLALPGADDILVSLQLRRLHDVERFDEFLAQHRPDRLASEELGQSLM